MRIFIACAFIVCLVSGQGRNNNGRGNSFGRAFDRDEFTLALDDILGGGRTTDRNNNGNGRGVGAGRPGASDFFDRLSNTLRNSGIGAPTAPTTAAPTRSAPLPGQTDLDLPSMNGISAEFAALFRRSPEKVSKYVQLSFHQCIGGCDGCLDLTAPDNKGLIATYGELRRMHTKWASVVSLADYGILSAYASYKAGVEADREGCNFGPCTIPLTFTSGRRTCANPDNPQRREFPHGSDEKSPITFLKDEFRLTDIETVALMGGHSVGENHLENSGFDGEWDLSPRVLDNGYFQAMDRIVNWEQSQNKPGPKAPQWEGRSRANTPLTMLHADMILNFDFTVNPTTKRASCTGQSPIRNITNCPLSNQFSSHVRSFSNNNANFLRVLARAVEKMSNTANFDQSKRNVFGTQ